MTAEILELKATVSELQRNTVASTSEQPTARVNAKATGETCKFPWDVVASRGCAKASKGKHSINGTASLPTHKTKHQYVENQGQPSSSPGSHSRRVPIKDARKV